MTNTVLHRDPLPTPTPTITRITRFSPQPFVPLTLFTLFISMMFGCGTNGTATLRSVATPASLTFNPTTLAYVSTDVNTADVYLTDLPKATLDPDADLAGVSGVLVHLHMFITPLAGETPIANSACSATFRAVVIADGNIGVYGGGGFLAPSQAPGGPKFGGQMRDASCRLSTHSKGFVDRLGYSTFSSDFRVLNNPPTAKLLERRLGTILASLPPPAPIEPPKPIAPAKAAVPPKP